MKIGPKYEMYEMECQHDSSKLKSHTQHSKAEFLYRDFDNVVVKKSFCSHFTALCQS
jgi:hypothetical protein